MMMLTSGSAMAQSPHNAPDMTAEALQEMTSREVPNDTIVAKVNGQPVYVSELILLYEDLPPQYQQVPLQDIYEQLVARLIDRKLLATEAFRNQQLEDKETLRRAQFAVEDVVLTAFVSQKVNALLTEEALRADYAELTADMDGMEEVEARHILVRSREEAQALIKQIADGADFAELAKKNSVGPSASSGGSLGFFQRGQMVPAFEDAAFALSPGGVSAEPVESKFGWHVIKVEQKRPVQAPSFEEALPQLRSAANNDIVSKLVGDLREGATIETFPPEGLGGEEGKAQ
ncbi:MAG TPA: peptidylprolyl isomerase [Alphaproteobacteria bacterium]|nr:peptidylprolyl isomerase [Alphaproteobacteria bacterium]HBC54201.1 peptidylprolyl isomerase [Alphaproteobacteria bacterium]HCO91844.1 peptidylprolyl isomerase [Alphaproteobacteria bacterium]